MADSKPTALKIDPNYPLRCGELTAPLLAEIMNSDTAIRLTGPVYVVSGLTFGSFANALAHVHGLTPTGTVLDTDRPLQPSIPVQPVVTIGIRLPTAIRQLKVRISGLPKNYSLLLPSAIFAVRFDAAERSVAYLFEPSKFVYNGVSILLVPNIPVLSKYFGQTHSPFSPAALGSVIGAAQSCMGSTPVMTSVQRSTYCRDELVSAARTVLNDLFASAFNLDFEQTLAVQLWAEVTRRYKKSSDESEREWLESAAYLLAYTSATDSATLRQITEYVKNGNSKARAS